MESIENLEKIIELIKTKASRQKYREEGEINLDIGKIITKYHMKMYFKFEIVDKKAVFGRNSQALKREDFLDGLFAVRTSLKPEEATAKEVIEKYKNLSQVESAFESINIEHVNLSNLSHYDEKKVRAHIFVNMLAYHVAWHLRRAWRPLLAAEDEPLTRPKTGSMKPKRKTSKAKTGKIKNQEDESAKPTFRELFERFYSVHKCVVDLDFINLPPASFPVQTKMSPLLTEAWELLSTIEP
jgi:transposase